VIQYQNNQTGSAAHYSYSSIAGGGGGSGGGVNNSSSGGNNNNNNNNKSNQGFVSGSVIRGITPGYSSFSEFSESAGLPPGSFHSHARTNYPPRAYQLSHTNLTPYSVSECGAGATGATGGTVVNTNPTPTPTPTLLPLSEHLRILKLSAAAPIPSGEYQRGGGYPGASVETGSVKAPSRAPGVGLQWTGAAPTSTRPLDAFDPSAIFLPSPHTTTSVRAEGGVAQHVPVKIAHAYSSRDRSSSSSSSTGVLGERDRAGMFERERGGERERYGRSPFFPAEDSNYAGGGAQRKHGALPPRPAPPTTQELEATTAYERARRARLQDGRPPRDPYS